MAKTKRIHGQSVSSRSYKIIRNNNFGYLVSIPKLSGLKPGDKVFVEKMDNGVILLVPEKIN